MTHEQRAWRKEPSSTTDRVGRTHRQGRHATRQRRGEAGGAGVAVAGSPVLKMQPERYLHRHRKDAGGLCAGLCAGLWVATAHGQQA